MPISLEELSVEHIAILCMHIGVEGIPLIDFESMQQLVTDSLSHACRLTVIPNACAVAQSIISPLRIPPLAVLESEGLITTHSRIALAGLQLLTMRFIDTLIKHHHQNHHNPIPLPAQWGIIGRALGPILGVTASDPLGPLAQRLINHFQAALQKKKKGGAAAAVLIPTGHITIYLTATRTSKAYRWDSQKIKSFLIKTNHSHLHYLLQACLLTEDRLRKYRTKHKHHMAIAETLRKETHAMIAYLASIEADISVLTPLPMYVPTFPIHMLVDYNRQHNKSTDYTPLQQWLREQKRWLNTLDDASHKCLVTPAAALPPTQPIHRTSTARSVLRPKPAAKAGAAAAPAHATSDSALLATRKPASRGTL